MATKTKIERLRQELLSKYGDPVVFVSYDYYKRHLLTPGAGGRLEYPSDPCTVEEIHLSQLPVEAIPNTATFKHLEDMVRNHRYDEYGVLVEESKQEYESDTQKEYRKRMHEDFLTLMGSQFMGEAARIFHKPDGGIFDIDTRFLTKSTDVKDYGRVMINKNHNRQ